MPLIPGDPELAVALRATHVGGVGCDGRAGAAGGADRVARAPRVGWLVGGRGTRHERPVAWPGEERLQKSSWDPDALAPRHLEDSVVRREAYDAVPGAAPEAAAHVLLEAGPGAWHGVTDWLHVCNLRGAMGGCQLGKDLGFKSGSRDLSPGPSGSTPLRPCVDDPQFDRDRLHIPPSRFVLDPSFREVRMVGIWVSRPAMWPTAMTF